MSVRSTRRTRGLREESRPRVTEAPKSSGQAPGPERSRLLLVRVLASASKTRTRATAMAAVDDLLVIRVRDQTTVCDFQPSKKLRGASDGEHDQGPASTRASAARPLWRSPRALERIGELRVEGVHDQGR